ncbi:MAG: carboxypeptidase-like regulatory domain-containing protein, partial [Gemmatimonadota bacterium]|nr:carboxypeptidase-like regulatory domain-containing protein [Gemmatimonadota bacterium]
MRFGRVLLAILIATSLSSIPTHGSAQTVLARVLDGEDSRPVFGALAYLVDSEGTVLKSALTDQLGRALFVGLQAGAFRVRVEMIGKATVETDLFQVAAGATATQDVRLQSSAIVLEGLQVEAEGGRCRVRPSQGVGVANLWDEARKALSAAAFTDREAIYLYRTTSYTRDLALDAKTIQREEERTGTKLFDSKPAEDLIENGFVQKDG